MRPTAPSLSPGDSIFQVKGSTLTVLAEAVRELRERVPLAPRVGFEADIQAQPSGKRAWLVHLVHQAPRSGRFHISEFQFVSGLRSAENLVGSPSPRSPAVFDKAVVDQKGDVTLRDGTMLYNVSFEYDPRARPILTENQKEIVRAVRRYLELPGGILPVAESDRQIEIISGATLAELSAGIRKTLGRRFSDETIRLALIGAGLWFAESRGPRKSKAAEMSR